MRKVQDDPAVNNPSIIKYLMTTNVAELIKTNQAIDDEIAWCASFVNWCLLNSTPKQDAINSATAEHWKNYGEPAPIGTLGAITVVKTDGGHHVGFFAGYYKKEGQFIMLGGNQGYDIDTNTHSKQTRISRCNFSTSQIVGNRMPPAKKENK